MGNEPIIFTLPQAWTWFIAACAAFITLTNAWKALRDVRDASPNSRQNEILALHEERLKLIEERLEKGDSRFERIDTGSRVTQKALLALMSHAINGNDVDKLQNAKNELETYLIGK